MAKSTDFQFDDRNANSGTERGFDMLVKNVERNGVGRPILVDKNGVTVAGNKSLEAIIANGIEDAIVVESEGDRLIVHKRLDLDVSTPRGREMALADNRIGQVSLAFNPEVVAGLAAEGVAVDLYWTPQELDDIPPIPVLDLDDPFGGEGGEGNGDGRGDLLGVLGVSIGDPQHVVEKGEVWILHDVGVLVCDSVIEGWRNWVEYLDGDVLFLPHPNPYIFMSDRINGRSLILVQPDPWIAGHTLDRFVELYPDNGVSRG